MVCLSNLFHLLSIQLMNQLNKKNCKSYQQIKNYKNAWIKLKGKKNTADKFG